MKGSSFSYKNLMSGNICICLKAQEKVSCGEGITERHYLIFIVAYEVALYIPFYK